MKAVIFGVTGQDGSYLSEFLLEKDYEVVGVARRSSTNTYERLTSCLHHPNFQIVEGDITDGCSVSGIIRDHTPDECYNLAAMSHVGTSFSQPEFTFKVNAVGVLNILEAVRQHSPATRFYQANTSEMFGYNYTEENGEKFQNEDTEFNPCSPYAVAKVAAHHLVDIYRKAYGLHASAGLLYNHESSRRGENFVTRKVTKWIGEFEQWRDQEFITKPPPWSLPPNQYPDEDYLCYGKPMNGPVFFPKLRLGNLDSCRDWGHAIDYVSAMWAMLQQDKPDDYVIATGQTHTVRDFVKAAFSHVDLNYEDYIIIDPKFYRPMEVDYLLGDASKAKRVLGWEPQITFDELVKEMVESDINHAKQEKDPA